jgi:hypothetical protein
MLNSLKLSEQWAFRKKMDKIKTIFFVWSDVCWLQPGRYDSYLQKASKNRERRIWLTAYRDQ